MKTSLFCIFIALLLFSSCSKSSDQEKDRLAPEVVINQPITNQVYTAGQQIIVAGTVSDNSYIREIHVEISNLDTGEEYIHAHIHPASAQASYSQTLTATAGTNYLIRVLAEDPSNNISSKSVEISCP